MRVNLSALRQICGEPYGFWLDSAMIDGRLGQTSFCGLDPLLVLRSKGTSVELVGRSRVHRCQASPFEVLRHLLREHRRSASRPGRFAGAVGYLAYDLRRFVEKVPYLAADDLGLPECYLCFYDDIARFDPRLTAVSREAPAWRITGPPAAEDSRRPPKGRGTDSPSHAPASRLGSHPSRSPLVEPIEVPAATFTPEAYRLAVERVQEYIFAGDVYQVNLSQRFQLALRESPFDVYLRLRSMNPAHFAAYINLPEVQVLSASP